MSKKVKDLDNQSTPIAVEALLRRPREIDKMHRLMTAKDSAHDSAEDEHNTHP